MSDLLTELSQQPAVLRDLVQHYQQNPQLLDLSALPPENPWVLTGMGASFHAASICALHLNFLGIQAVAIEAVDLVHYATALRGGARNLVYFSQSGNSGEIARLLPVLDPRTRLIGVTNDSTSLLANHAQVVLPLVCGEEEYVAGKTYTNSLAVGWMLARRAVRSPEAPLFAALNRVADLQEQVLSHRETIVERLTAAFSNSDALVFAGHGPHAITARADAMVLGEWPKMFAMHFGIGAFRHGFIEAAGPGTGAVIFSAPGGTQASALELAAELASYGACVLRVEQGSLYETTQPSQPAEIDEFLCPQLDILPFQLIADTQLIARGFPPGFRYISKVIRHM